MIREALGLKVAWGLSILSLTGDICAVDFFSSVLELT